MTFQQPGDKNFLKKLLGIQKKNLSLQSQIIADVVKW